MSLATAASRYSAECHLRLRGQSCAIGCSDTFDQACSVCNCNCDSIDYAGRCTGKEKQCKRVAFNVRQDGMMANFMLLLLGLTLLVGDVNVNSDRDPSSLLVDAFELPFISLHSRLTNGCCSSSKERVTTSTLCIKQKPMDTKLRARLTSFSSKGVTNDNSFQCNSNNRHQISSTALFSSVDSDASFTQTNNNTPLNPAVTPSSANTNNEYSFFDEATIYIRAGSGGQGSSTYKKGVNSQNGPPDGGNGGKGGNVVLKLDDSLNTLAGLARYAWKPNSFGGGGGAKRRGGGGSGGNASGGDASTTTRVLSFRAENGADGARQCKQGRNGKDIVVRVPPGTVVQQEIMDPNANSEDGTPTYIDQGTITHANPTLVIATGGQGGEGSALHSTLQRGVRRPRTPPQGGERKRLKLTLKVVADVALVAVPNAGKSTLLSKVTRAKPKIADYPFTTVVPNLGVWVPSNALDAFDDEEEEYYEYDVDGNPIASSISKSLILCDVPGLIAGASEGVGLGHAFLRHVERCHVILHLLDATSNKVLEEYAMINRELLNYGTGKLARMPQVVVVNKLDVAFDEGNVQAGMFKSKEELEAKLQAVMPHSRLMWISAKEGEGVDDLMERVAMFVKKVKEASATEEKKQTAVAAETGED